jgi:hypothetical protein
VNVPIKRGTARRLSLRRPLRSGEYYAPLRPPEFDLRQLGFSVNDINPDVLSKLLRGPAEESAVSTWSGGEWVKTEDRIDYRPGAAT